MSNDESNSALLVFNSRCAVILSEMVKCWLLSQPPSLTLSRRHQNQIETKRAKGHIEQAERLQPLTQYTCSLYQYLVPLCVNFSAFNIFAFHIHTHISFHLSLWCWFIIGVYVIFSYDCCRIETYIFCVCTFNVNVLNLLLLLSWVLLAVVLSAPLLLVQSLYQCVCVCVYFAFPLCSKKKEKRINFVLLLFLLSLSPSIMLLCYIHSVCLNTYWVVFCFHACLL